MIHVGWLVGTVVVLVALGVFDRRAMLAEIRALSRALIANNAKDLAIIDRAAPERPTILPRRAPAHEADFTEPTLRPLGL